MIFFLKNSLGGNKDTWEYTKLVCGISPGISNSTWEPLPNVNWGPWPAGSGIGGYKSQGLKRGSLKFPVGIQKVENLTKTKRWTVESILIVYRSKTP